MLFIKLDIAKAFDMVYWSYLFELLQKIGFGPRWRSWISTMLASASLRFLLNGIPGRPIKHKRSLRQGNPLSPMLFILAIGPLQRILRKALIDQVIQPALTGNTQAAISMYADDTAIFVQPKHEELQALHQILQTLGQAAGLRVNLTKTDVYTINCDQIDLEQLCNLSQLA